MNIDKKCNKNSCRREYATLRNVVTGGASDCDKAIYGKIMSDGITIIIVIIVSIFSVIVIILCIVVVEITIYAILLRHI